MRGTNTAFWLMKKEFGCGLDEFGERLKPCGVQIGVQYPRGMYQQPVYAAKLGKQTLTAKAQLAETI
tara:strand:- start:69 stop:269 length:201 start_codon:yes stop_codon:yes gene_type:complete